MKQIELTPLTDIEAERLAPVMRSVVANNKDELLCRNFVGVMERYHRQSGEESIEWIKRAQNEQRLGRLGAFILKLGGEFAGLGTIYPDLQLTRLRLPVRRAYGSVPSPWPVKVTYRLASPNVTAWLDGDADHESLTQAYSRLLVKAASLKTNGTVPWTLEPENAPHFIHEAIQQAGLVQQRLGRFDDQETISVPGYSWLYATVDEYRLRSSRIDRLLSTMSTKPSGPSGSWA